MDQSAAQGVGARIHAILVPPQVVPKDKHRKVSDQVGKTKRESWQVKSGEGSQKDQVGEQKQGRDAWKDQQVPGDADAPEHIAAQQEKDASTTLHECCHKEGGQRWSKRQKRYPEHIERDVQESKDNQFVRPGKGESHQKVEQQWRTTQQLHQMIGGGRRLTPSVWQFHRKPPALIVRTQ